VRRRRGFSLTEFLVVATLLALVALAALDLLDRRTRIGTGSVDELDHALRVASQALARGVRNAGCGGVARPLSVLDDTPAGASFVTPSGPIAARPGTDQLRVRGVLESSLVALDGIDAATGTPVTGALLGRRPSDARLRVPAWPRGSLEEGGPRASALEGRLRAALAVPGAAPMFLVRDELGRSAAARVVALDSGNLTETCLAARPAEGATAEPCGLELRLDFTDARATDWSSGTDAVSRLGHVRDGGLLDDETFFVARGDESSGFAHPYLARARGEKGRFQVDRLAEEIEDLQVAVRRSGRFVPEAPGDRPMEPGSLSDALGRPLVSMLKLALVAKASAPSSVDRTRWLSARGPDGLSGILLMNARRPPTNVAGADPVGFARALEDRVPYARRALVFEVRPRGFAGERDTP
jgi:prepilin-type N-terminal cleavage/methylation domain-containing protein